MGWGNAANIVTANLDSGSDSPASARANLKAALDELTAVINGRGAASGVASLDSSTLVPLAQLPITPISTGRTIDFTAGTGKSYVVPAGVTMLRVRACGGGGGGGYTSSFTGGNHGGGGGGGGHFDVYITVVPGSTITYSVGAGGTGATSVGDVDGSGTNGGNSSITTPGSATPASTTFTAYGGGGGEGGASGSGGRFGGAGGDCSVANSSTDAQRQGGAGASGSTKGGTGGSSGDGTPAVAGFNAARHYGGGGGFGSGVGTAGYSGLPGYVEFSY